MFVFRKIWRDFFSCYLRFEICPFAFLPAILRFNEVHQNSASLTKWFIYRLFNFLSFMSRGPNWHLKEDDRRRFSFLLTNLSKFLIFLMTLIFPHESQFISNNNNNRKADLCAVAVFERKNLYCSLCLNNST